MHPANHDSGQQFARKRHRHRFGRDQISLEAEQSAGEPCHHRRQDKGGELVMLDRVALKRRAQLVLADRHQHVPERRTRHAQQQIEHAECDQRDQDVVGARLVEIDRPDAAALEIAETVLSARHVAPAEGDRVGQRRERECQQREVHATPAQDEKTDHERENRDKQHREDDRDRDLTRKPSQLRERGRVGADAEPCAVAERRQPGVADEQIEPESRDGEDHHDRGGAGGQAERAHRERQHGQRDRGDPQRPVLCERVHSNFSMRSPSSPRGRTSSTRNINT